MNLNLARTVSRSAVNGPGERFVVWTQGCPIACKGCWNRDTWSFAKRNILSVSNLTNQICTTSGIEGVTFTGGEPFAQALALSELARAVRLAGLSVFVFSGYALEELHSASQAALLAQVDVLVAGRYDEEKRDLDLPWRSSTNQRVHFLTERYALADLSQTPSVEVHISANGTLMMTGFPPDGLRNESHRR